MDSLHQPLSDILKAAPLEAIPKQFSYSYLYLKLLIQEQLCESIFLSEKKALEVLGKDPRSARQRLMNEASNFWNIIPVYDDKGLIIGRKLDPRHLSGDPELDQAARRERQKQLRVISHKQAVQGRKREPKAFTEMTVANKEYFKSLGGAANDSIFEKEKPTKS